MRRQQLPPVIEISRNAEHGCFFACQNKSRPGTASSEVRPVCFFFIFFCLFFFYVFFLFYFIFFLFSFSKRTIAHTTFVVFAGVQNKNGNT